MTAEEIKAVPLAIQLKLDQQTMPGIQTAAALETNVWLKEIAFQLAIANEREAYQHQKQSERENPL